MLTSSTGQAMLATAWRYGAGGGGELSRYREGKCHTPSSSSVSHLQIVQVAGVWMNFRHPQSPVVVVRPHRYEEWYSRRYGYHGEGNRQSPD